LRAEADVREPGTQASRRFPEVRFTRS
jgi:hypothetical protein